MSLEDAHPNGFAFIITQHAPSPLPPPSTTTTTPITIIRNVPLRPNIDHLLKPLAYRGIPLTVFSTGYGEVLVQILRLTNPGE